MAHDAVISSACVTEWKAQQKLHSFLDASCDAIAFAGSVGIFSGNTVEWMLAMQAGNYYSVYIGENLSAAHQSWCHG